MGYATEIQVYRSVKQDKMRVNEVSCHLQANLIPHFTSGVVRNNIETPWKKNTCFICTRILSESMKMNVFVVQH